MQKFLLSHITVLSEANSFVGFFYLILLWPSSKDKVTESDLKWQVNGEHKNVRYERVCQMIKYLQHKRDRTMDGPTTA